MASKVGVVVRMAEAERETLKAAAERVGLSMESWARGILLHAASGTSFAIPTTGAEPALAPVKVLTVAQVRKRFPTPKPEKGSALGHGPHCQCLACRGRAQ